MGLVRLALDAAGFAVAFANDIDESKRDLYENNFGRNEFVCGDVCDLHADDVPDVEIATASFPCTDLSLAGNRAGLDGEESSMFWEFARILGEMADDDRLPAACLLENVPSFATSHGGADLREAIAELNSLGYWCDLFVIDARRFVAQSRPRLFIVGTLGGARWPRSFERSDVRPVALERFAERSPDLLLHAAPIQLPPREALMLPTVVERLRPSNPRWWDDERVARFCSALSPLQEERLAQIRRGQRLSWATAYRRTRAGRPMWEIRGDAISGCLRTARGGSSKQALVEAGRGVVRVRWMTPREYARLQGAPDDYKLGAVTENQALFALGDAVCVPVVEWIAQQYLRPLVEGVHTPTDAVAYG
jgi:DNA (cytosine-5)-methyltransferase 1